MLEEERKFGVAARFAMPDLATSLPAGGQVRACPPVTLRATYHDTTDLRLARSGASLRYRRGERGAPWTAKLPTDIPGTRHEISVKAPSGTPPDELLDLVTAYTRGAPVAPQATLRTVRHAYELLAEDGTVLAEVVDDAVTVLEGRKVRARFREIEVERKGGGRKLLDRVARLLTAAGAEAGDFVPKNVRALGDRAAAPPDLPPAEPVRRRATVGEVAIAALRRDIGRIVAHDPLVRLRAEVGDGDTAVHQMRVGCRRLRSDLRAFGPVLDPQWTARLRTEVQGLADVLGAARDAEVLRRRLRHTAAADPLAPLDTDSLSILDAALAARQDTALAAVDDMLRTDRYHALLDELTAAAQDPPSTAAAGLPARDILPGLVSKPWRRLTAEIAELAPDAPDADWHAVRIRAKRARYTVEAAATVVGGPGRRLAKALTAVQDLLGEHQDAVVAAETWLAIAGEAPDDHTLAVTAGRLAERERRAVRDQRCALPDVWRRATRRKLTEWLR